MTKEEIRNRLRRKDRSLPRLLATLTREDKRDRFHRRKDKAIISILAGRSVPCDSCTIMTCCGIERFKTCQHQEYEIARRLVWQDRRYARADRGGRLPWE